MAFFQGNIYSKTLGMETQLYVSMPFDRRYYQGDDSPKTLFLLHGLTDNASAWFRFGNADFLAEKYGITIVSPEVQKSFYQDMRYGLSYRTYVAEELPETLGKLFRISLKREDMMVAGLSMGGYGALRLALGMPELFSACGAFSGCVDLQQTIGMLLEAGKHENGEDAMRNECIGLYGSELTIGEENDLFRLAEKAALQSIKPRLYLACGTEDYLHEQNERFQAHVSKLSIDMKYEEWTGEHNWTFWNQALPRMLEFFLKNQSNG